MIVINLSTIQEAYIKYSGDTKEKVREEGRFCILHAERFALVFRDDGQSVPILIESVGFAYLEFESHFKQV